MACIFCGFIEEKIKEHLSGYTFLKVYENKKIFVFLGSPEKEVGSADNDLLIIPKKHYEFIEEVPADILCELNRACAFSAGFLRKKYGGAKILLNNGASADQYIKHTHFHIIPKKKGGESVWVNLTIEEFREISNWLEKEFGKF